MKKTFLQIKESDQLVAQLYANDENLQKGKFGYAWKRFIEKNYKPLVVEINEKMDDARIDNALTDPNTGEILYNGENYKFGKEGVKALIEYGRKLDKQYNERLVEIIPFLVKKADLPALTDEEQEILKGLVI